MGNCGNVFRRELLLSESGVLHYRLVKNCMRGLDEHWYLENLMKQVQIGPFTRGELVVGIALLL